MGVCCGRIGRSLSAPWVSAVLSKRTAADGKRTVDGTASQNERSSRYVVKNYLTGAHAVRIVTYMGAALGGAELGIRTWAQQLIDAVRKL